MVKDLTSGKPEKVLVDFCIPLLGSVVFQQLYNIADSLVAGRYAGEDALAAVGNSYEITLIYLAFAFGCNMGCSVIVSQLFGAKRYNDMKTAVHTTFIFSGILCLVLMLVGFLCATPMLHMINTPENIMKDSKLYLDVYTGGIIFLFMYNIATGIFSALGDSRTPFIFLAFSSVANVFMDMLFVKELGMGVAGVAWATFICQGVSSVLSVICVLKKLSGIEASEEGRVRLFSFDLLKKIIAIAVPSTLQQSFVSVGNIILQGRINNYGSGVTAGYAAAVKLNNMVITTLTALGNGISNFSAQNLGAGEYGRIKQGHKAGVKLAIIMCVAVSVLYLFAGSFLVDLFMDSDAKLAHSVGVEFLHIVSPFYLVIGIKLVTDGVLRGIGAMMGFIVGTFTDLGLRVFFAFLFSELWQETGIWCAWPGGWILGMIVSYMLYRVAIKKIQQD